MTPVLISVVRYRLALLGDCASTGKAAMTVGKGKAVAIPTSDNHAGVYAESVVGNGTLAMPAPTVLAAAVLPERRIVAAELKA